MRTHIDLSASAIGREHARSGAVASWRFPLLVAAILALTMGLWGGLTRMGWAWPAPTGAIIEHGGIMVGGFLGTLLGLERAVALGRRWCYIGPAASAAGAILLIAGAPPIPAIALMLLASLVMLLDFYFILRRRAAMFTLVMATGAAAWVVGNALWLAGQPIEQLVFWWIGFLVLTIAGERLELSRLLPQSAQKCTGFAAAATLFLLGLAVTSFYSGLGEGLAGLGLVAVATWLAIYDVARRTVSGTGLTRFVAVCLLSGYLWLGVAGILAAAYGAFLPLIHGEPAAQWALGSGANYDATLHALFLGFVFAMIFGHAPIIFPAVLGVRIVYSRRFYIHLLVLQISVLGRIAGDLFSDWTLRRWSGLLSAFAIILFFSQTVFAIRRNDRLPPGQSKGGLT